MPSPVSLLTGIGIAGKQDPCQGARFVLIKGGGGVALAVNEC